MEVERQPSSGVSVVILFALLLACLWAPRLWQREVGPASVSDTGPNNNQFMLGRVPKTNPASLLNSPYNFGNRADDIHGRNQNSGAQNPWSPPSIEQLVADHSGVGQFNTLNVQSGPTGADWPSVSYPSYDALASQNIRAIPYQTADLTPFVTNSLTAIGESIAKYSPANLVGTIASHIADSVPAYVNGWRSITPVGNDRFTSRSAINLVHPGDRLALLPAPPKKTSWCVPQALFDQLGRLAEPAYTAQWASHVGNQLHAITERDQLEGDDVQLILADLADAANEAILLAEMTDDDQLRVELLRAHWALARRLDCWTAMHEERVAYNVRGRVAARGDLSPYFGEATSDSPAPAEASALSTQLEQYENTRDPQLARQVVEQQRILAASPASFDRALADAVEQHYRNANVRVALTAQMVNRWVAGNKSESRPVREIIAGAYVAGQSDIYSERSALLTPSNEEWQIQIQARGTVQSNTMATSGPARLRSQGATDFTGNKFVVVSSEGVHLQPSDVNASSRSRLVGVTTDYDWMPMVGNVARDRAADQFHAKQSWVRALTESRVSSEAGETLDRDTQEAVERARQRLYTRFTERFDRNGIKLTTIEMKTTPDRLVARLRVASDEQLGSHTPRPRALSDSLASVQLHESALNYMAITLGLDGQRLTAAELQDKLRDQFPGLVVKDIQEIHHDTIFQFAPKDAVQFRVNDGKLELKVALTEVVVDGESIPDVVIHTNYAPVIDRLNADLERQGALGVEGQLNAGERAQLHNVFETVFPPERRLKFAHVGDDDRLEGLMITQLVLEDGWVGIAIGPESPNRVSERFRSLR